MIIFTNAFIFYKLVNCLRQRTMNSPNTEKNLSLLKFLGGFWASNRMQKTLLQLLTLAISNKKGFISEREELVRRVDRILQDYIGQGFTALSFGKKIARGTDVSIF